MLCPYCDGDSQVVDSRVTSDAVRRRRHCTACKRRFTTYERASAPLLKVIKRSERVEAFDSKKLITALNRVCRGRAMIDEETIRRVARNIEAQLVDAAARTVRSSQIASLALERLGELDRVAYNRLAANYIDEDGHLRIESRAMSPEEAAQLGLFSSDPDAE